MDSEKVGCGFHMGIYNPMCAYCEEAQPAAPSNVDDPETWKGIERSYDAAPPAPTAVQQSYCNICGQGVVDGTLACGHVYTGWLDKTPAPQGGKCFGKHGPAPATRPAAPPTPQGLETGNVDSWIFRYARENAPSDAVGVDIYSAQGTLIGSLDLKEKVEIPAPDTRPTEAQEPKAQDDPTWMDDCINVCSRHSLQFTKERDECFICTNRAANAPDYASLLEAAEKIKKIADYLEEHCGKDADFILRAETKSGTMDIVIRKNIAALRTAIAAVKKERS